MTPWRSRFVSNTVLVLALGCRSDMAPEQPPWVSAREPARAPVRTPHVAEPNEDTFTAERAAMVETTIAGRGISDPVVLAAMRKVKRHELVPEDLRARAYVDAPLPIGFEQTISQPYIVAAMTEAAQLSPGEKVLEIGTGSGYQAAVLAELPGVQVYSIEIVEPLARRTHELLARMGYRTLNLRIGDGYRGWPEAAPFDAIIVTAAPEQIPAPLLEQLAVGGRLVIPVGTAGEQDLRVITRGQNGTTSETLFEVRFVPMTGESQRPRD